MRRIICRFDDGPAFLNSIDRPSFGAPTLTFLADFPLRDGELVRTTIIIEATGERHDLHLRIQRRAPHLDNGSPGACFRYLATATDEDTPWLEMLIAKYTTARRVTV